MSMVFRMMVASISAACLALVLPMPTAQAAKPLPVTIAEQPDAPLKILEARSAFEDTRVTSNFYWRIYAKVRNVTDRRIVAYQLQWRLFNAFDEQIDSATGTDNDPLGPGAEKNEGWEKVDLSRATGVRVTVAVLRVRFEDGATWSTSAPLAQVPTCTDALKAERARLLQIYQVQGLDALLAELRK